tara:strand:+ start:405 stop:752 length:348 start_codon:yes stop_codon:yes gene_type:complete
MDMKLVAQAGIMVATLAGGYAVVRNQLARVIQDLEDHIKRSEDHKAKFDARLDNAESERAVFSSRVDVLADISSVKNLAELNTRLARLEMGQEILFKEMEVQKKLHNGSHPRTDA